MILVFVPENSQIRSLARPTTNSPPVAVNLRSWPFVKLLSSLDESPPVTRRSGPSALKEVEFEAKN